MKIRLKSSPPIILLLILILSSSFSHSEEKIPIFRKYNFEEGGYSILGIIAHNQGHELQEMLGNFYTDDVEVLREIKQSWVTDAPSPIFACGYHFYIFVIHNGQELESFSINVEEGCNTIATDHGHYFFNPKLISAFKDKFKPALHQEKQFSSLQEGRNYIKSISKSDDLLMMISPKWLDFEGEFRFWFECNESFKNGSTQRCLELSKTKLIKQYPDEKFDIAWAGSSKDKISIRIRCKKSLYDNFNLYPIDWKWRDYSPTLRIFWRTKHQSNFK